MSQFWVFVALFSFIPWLQVTHCNEIKLDTKLSEFLSKFPFNLEQVFAESEINETNYEKKLFDGSQCFLDMQRIFVGMAARELWAFKGRPQV